MRILVSTTDKQLSPREEQIIAGIAKAIEIGFTAPHYEEADAPEVRATIERRTLEQMRLLFPDLIFYPA